MSVGLNSQGEALNLPEPKIEPVPFKIEGADVSEVMSELTGSKATEKASVIQPTITQPNNAAKASATAAMVDITSQNTPITGPMTPVISTATTTATPAMADDNDLIEKEWVEKAKQIVERTKDDPHAQNNEISQYKAEYIKRRFNREIKGSEK